MRTDFKDDIFDGKRKYNMINNPDGTVSFTDATVYTQTGDSFGAKELNDMGNELAGKQDKLVSGTNIKTLNGESLLGTGNIFIKGGTSSDEVTARKADVLKGKTTITNDSADEIVAGTLEVQSIINFNLSLYASETVMGAWQKPAKGPYSGVRVIYRTDRYPNNPDDGTLAYEGNGINFTKKLPIGTKHYFAAYSYMTTNFGRIYYEVPAKAEFTTSKVQGRQVFKSNGAFTVPAAVRNVQVFLVGGGGGGSRGYSPSSDGTGGHGGGGGYTKTQNISVTPGQNISVIVGGGGGEAANGGTSKFGNVSVSGGGGGQIPWNFTDGKGKPGNGGSGGGRGGRNYGQRQDAGYGGSDGSDGTSGDYNYTAGTGQHSTTREFAQSGATLYSGGGAGGYFTRISGGPGAGGGGAVNTPGSANTGGGGGAGRYGSANNPGQPGGSGIVIVRWGY